MQTQQDRRREPSKKLTGIEDQVAAQNLLAIIAADEVARFMTAPMDLSKFQAGRQ